MAESFRPAGYYELKSFKITSYDRSKEFEIKGLIHSFEISESITRGSVRGSATIHESFGLLRGFPLRGEEYVEITYEDFYEVQHTDKFLLYSITGVKPSSERSNGTISYTIHFVSTPKVFTEDVKLRRAYNGLVSSHVEDIFSEFYADFTDKEIKIQSTDGNQRLVVPNYKPEQAMFFMARKAYNAESFSQSFRFFENRTDFIFSTDEYLQSEIYTGNFILAQNYVADSTPEAQELLQRSIVSIEYPMLVNTIEDIDSGGYKRAYYAVDLLNNIINPTVYDYTFNFSGNNPNQRLFHTEKFIQERITTQTEKWFIQDYSTEGMPTGPAVRPNTNYAEIHNRKLSHFYHTKRNKTLVTIHGNNSIVAGMSIFLDIMTHEAESGPVEDKQKSGLFIVETIDNIFYEDKYFQKLTLIRNGVGDDGF